MWIELYQCFFYCSCIYSSSCVIWDSKRLEALSWWMYKAFSTFWVKLYLSLCVCVCSWSIGECQKATRAHFRPFVWLFCSLDYGRSSGILLCWLSLLKCQQADWGAVGIIVNRQHDGLSQLHYDAQIIWVDTHRLQHPIASCILLSRGIAVGNTVNRQHNDIFYIIMHDTVRLGCS